MHLQDFGKKLVVAIPLAHIIQRNEKQVTAFQDIQDIFAIFPLSDGIAQRRAKPVENGGLQ